VVVLDVDEPARRIRLSVTGVQKQRETSEVREYTERADAAAPEGFGTLADRLRDALKGRQK
jgi:predicted RNA-binding protein with RPS1 domain